MEVENENRQLEFACSKALVEVRLECAARNASPGGLVQVKVAISAREPIKASGVFVDLLDTEEVALRAHVSPALCEQISVSYQAMNETFRISAPFALHANETKIFEGRFQLPINFQPTFAGRFSKHEWQIRARIETLRGDADSGFQSFKIGAGI